MDKSDATLERMRSFVRVAERGSFSAVAREQGVGQATITRHVAELERALGVRLINRTTRQLNLTAEGTGYHAQARTILRLVDEAAEGVQRAGDGLAGTIRVSCTAALAVRHVTRAIFAFQDRYPQVAIDLNVSDVPIDMVREAADIAVRLGPLADSTMQRKLIGDSRRVLVAARDYLDRHGRPTEPAALERHHTIRMSNIADSQNLVLRHPEHGETMVPFGGRLLVDHGLAAREAIAAGRGIAPAHLWLVDDLLSSGAVEIVMADYALAPVSLSILVVPGRLRLQRVRLLVDALAPFLKSLPGVQRAAPPVP